MQAEVGAGQTAAAETHTLPACHVLQSARREKLGLCVRVVQVGTHFPFVEKSWRCDEGHTQPECWAGAVTQPANMTC